MQPAIAQPSQDDSDEDGNDGLIAPTYYGPQQRNQERLGQQHHQNSPSLPSDGDLSTGRQFIHNSDREEEDAKGEKLAIPDQIQEFKDLLRFLELQETKNIVAPLATRAHLERVVEAYWQSWTGVESENDISSTGKDLDASSAAQRAESSSSVHRDVLRQTILQHPAISTSPYMLRWPLAALSVPRTRWSLADEVYAIVDREKRKEAKAAPGREENLLARQEGESSSSSLEDEQQEVLEMSIVLPAIARCQSSLKQLFHQLSKRAVPVRADQRRRIDTITWRDVLCSLKAEQKPVIPPSVLAATEKRLQGIFGTSTRVPSAPVLASLGMGMEDGLIGVIKRGGRVPFEKSEDASMATRPKAPKKRPFNAALDAELLLAPVSCKQIWLEDSPVKADKGKRRRV